LPHFYQSLSGTVTDDRGFEEEVSKREETSTWTISKYQVCDIVTKKNLRTRQDRDQESLLVKQSKERIVYNPEMNAGTSDNRCNECSDIRGIYGEKVGCGVGLNSL
jgi:hypothetical protein